jgi:DNA-binding transcriptional MerR regulator
MSARTVHIAIVVVSMYWAVPRLVVSPDGRECDIPVGASFKLEECGTVMAAPEYIPIATFARICGVSAKTLRFYGDIGLFRPAFIDPRSGYRFYLHEQLRDFAQIQMMRVCGASLADIRRATRAGRSDDEQRTFLQKLRNAKLTTIDEARRSLAWIDGVLQELEQPPPLHATVTYCAPVEVVSIRTDIKCYADIQQYETLLWESVAPRSRGCLRGVLWHRCADGGLLEGEPFVEVRTGSACPPAYRLKQLPGAHVARAFSSFDDEEAQATYIGLDRWIHARGYRLAAAKREIYRGNLLEIQYPLEAS